MTFRIRFITPPVVDDAGWPHAGGVFALGVERLFFLVDLRHWGMADYQRQWQSALERVAHGAPATALLTAYRGTGDAPHRGWAMWREDEWVYVQKQSFVPSESVEPFDPENLDAQVGPRLRATEQRLPIAEWRIELVHLVATVFRIRLPLNLR